MTESVGSVRLPMWRALCLVLVGCVLGGCGRGARPRLMPATPPAAAVTYAPMPAGADVNVTDAMLLGAANDTQDWLTYNHDFSSTRFVDLSQVDTSNVDRLRPVYAVQTGMPGGFETSPIVVGGVMFFTTAEGPQVWAVDARTGKPYWVYSYPQPKGLSLCCGPVNRGVAVAYGKVYVATLDAHLIALDARTGRLDWIVSLADPAAGYSETQAPLVYDHRVIIGISGGEFRIQGWIRAYNAETGAKQWQFNTVDYATGWGHDRALEGGGAAWMTGSLDPATNTLFYGTGNPSPDLNGAVRPGSNPYTDSTVALNLNTGRLKWYHQYTPHDVWDYDSSMPAVLLTAHIGGASVPALVHCDKNGYCYTLDRTTGDLLVKSQPFVRLLNYGVAPTKGGVDICPGAAGGSEWLPVAYDPATRDVYVSGINACARMTAENQKPRRGRPYFGSAFTRPVGQDSGTFTAIRVDSGAIDWQYDAPQPMVGGALATSGGLVFTGEQNGYFDALDAATGRMLWRFQTGAGIHAPASAFMLGGKEYIAVAAGAGGWAHAFGAFEAPNGKTTSGRLGDTLYVFALT